jgi:glyoxylase-like metal-dependent hydrolase (beta-lactamase superfamily II)
MTVTRRAFLVATTSASAAVLIRPPRLLAQAPAPAPAPTPTFKDLRGGVGIFEARGGTIGYHVASDALVVVDTQFPDTAKACLAGLRERSTRRIDVLVNTHHHGDHTAGNGVFREAAAKIVAHARVPELQKAAAERAGTVADQVYADSTFTDAWEQAVGAEKVSARYYGPAHTGGDGVIHFQKANVVHMGDLVFNRRHPVIDRPGGASIANWITLLEKVSAAHGSDTLYIFGHGDPAFGITGAKADLLQQRDYLSALLGAAKKSVSAGQSKDEFSKLAALPGFTDYGSVSPRFTLATVLGIAYDEVTNAK